MEYLARWLKQALTGLTVVVCWSTVSYAQDVSHFIDNPDDIELQQRICASNEAKAIENGSLDEARAARSDPACEAAKEARKQLDDKLSLEKQREWEQAELLMEELRQEVERLASDNSTEQLQAMSNDCSKEPHTELGNAWSECRILDRAMSIASQREKEAALTETARELGEAKLHDLVYNNCQSDYSQEECEHIRLSYWRYRERMEGQYDENKESARQMYQQCKKQMEAAVEIANQIDDPGTRMRKLEQVVNLKLPPFDRPISCTAAKDSLGEDW